MTLIKSVLLGSAAAIVTVAAAQAADLPTHKAAPVAQYVKICDVGGVTGWTLPGSDTCFKISGYVTAQFAGGSIANQYNSAAAITSTQSAALDPFAPSHLSQLVLVQGGDRALPIYNGITGAPILGTDGKQLILPNQQNATFNRNATGLFTRAQVTFDAASNTAYGPLIAHINIKYDTGSGYNYQSAGGGGSAYLDQGYVSWAGITAGKAPSFFSFMGGGDNWNNFFSPDRKGWNEPVLMAYTASFGGGFSATISAESPAGAQLTGGYNSYNSGSGPFASGVAGPITFGGDRWPDMVLALHVKQGWGEAQLSGLIHNVNVKDYSYYGATGCGLYTVIGVCDGSENKVGFALDAGVKFNLPWAAPGATPDALYITGAYSQNATWYSGLADAQNGEFGQVNGNGQAMYLADAYFNPLTNTWSTPKAWSVSAMLEHSWTPTIYTDLMGSVGGITWSGQSDHVCLGSYCYGTGMISPKALSWLAGVDLGWNPVTNLNFDLELMYQSTHQDAPSGFIGTVYNTGAFVPGAWQGNSNGFEGRLRITRYF